MLFFAQNKCGSAAEPAKVGNEDLLEPRMLERARRGCGHCCDRRERLPVMVKMPSVALSAPMEARWVSSLPSRTRSASRQLT